MQYLRLIGFGLVPLFVAESWFTLDAGYREFEKIEEGEPSCLVCCSILWRDSESDLCW